MKEGLAVARNRHSGIYQKRETVSANPDPDTKVADVSYHNDSLAQLIVEAWSDQAFKGRLTEGAHDTRSNEARRVLADRGLYLTQPIVITEKEYDEGFVWAPDQGVVLVLPNKERAGRTPQNQTLLETAKFLMACVPNGI
jgi:hypothetical protein